MMSPPQSRVRAVRWNLQQTKCHRARMAGFLHLPPHVELLVLTATMAVSIGLGLAMARATIFIVFSRLTRNMVGTHAMATASITRIGL
jgi:hypothetical protein